MTKLATIPICLFFGWDYFDKSGVEVERWRGNECGSKPVEIFVNPVRALVVFPNAAWSLLHHCATSGTVRRTDDLRTAEQGVVPFYSPTSYAHFVKPHLR